MFKKIMDVNYFKDLLSLFGVFYNTRLFTKKKNIFSLILFSIFFLILLTLNTFLKGNIGYSNLSFLDSLYVLILIPIFLLLFFLIFFIFISSFEDKKNKTKFFEGFLVTTSIILPFAVLSGFLSTFFSWILTFYTNSLVLSNFIVLVLFTIWIWFFIMLILELKGFFKTSSNRVIASWILTFLVLSFSILSYYLVILIAHTTPAKLAL